MDRMTDPAPLPERAVWQTAGEIVEQHGESAADYIIEQLSDVLDYPVAVEDWRRIAAAVDAISSVERPC